MRRNVFVAMLVVAGLALCVIAGREQAAAHAALDRSDPPAGAVLSESPGEIRLWFTEPLEVAFTGADLLDASGQPVPGTRARIATDNPYLLLLTLPGLADGPYTVAWRTLSSADSHTLEGYFGFSVGVAGAAAPLGEGSGATTDRARELTRGFALVGLAALLAVAPIVLIVLDPARKRVLALSSSLERPLRGYTVAAIGAAFLCSLAALAAQATSIAPDRTLPAAIAETLVGTRYGHFWLWRAVLLGVYAVLIAGALWGSAVWRRPLVIAATLVSLVLPIPFSLVSHAAAQSEGRIPAVTADALHLLLASVWAGGLFMLVLVLLPALRPLHRNERADALHAALPRFSIVGIAAWGVLALSGLYGAWMQVGTVAALRETDYGQALLLKGVLLLPVLALAAWHFVLGRASISDEQLRRFPRTLVLEAGLVVLVLLVAGRLIGLEPARVVVASRTPSAIERPIAFAADAGNRTGSLVISPGIAGVNLFAVVVDGEALPGQSEAVLRFSPVGRDIGEQELRLPAVSVNRFEASGDELALTGDWRITAIVRKIGAFSWATDMVVTIGVAPPAAPVADPPPHFRPGGAAGMLIVAIAIGLGAVAIGEHRAPHRTRASLAAACAVALVAGAAVLGAARIPPPVVVADSAEVAVVATPAPPASPETGHAAHHADHARSATPEAARLAAAGTPYAVGGLRVTLQPSSADADEPVLAVHVAGADGVPLTDARVVIAWEMPGMEGSRDEGIADEVEPGRYQVAAPPMAMPGEWQVLARVSPRGQPTSIARFVLLVR